MGGLSSQKVQRLTLSASNGEVCLIRRFIGSTSDLKDEFNLIHVDPNIIAIWFISRKVRLYFFSVRIDDEVK